MTDRAFWVGTFLGGPLAAGYIFSENFKTLNQPEKVKTTWLILILFTIVLFGTIFMIPESVKIPNQITPIIYTAIGYWIFKTILGNDIENHLKLGGEAYGFGRTIIVSLIGPIVTIIPVFVIAMGSDLLAEDTNVVTKYYDTAVRHEIFFDPSNISESEVDMLAKGFMKTNYFDDYVSKDVFVKKSDKKYTCSLFVIDSIQNDNEALEPFIQLRQQMDYFIKDKAVEFNLVVEHEDNIIKTLK